jgi:hypothetical protein
MKPTFEPKAQNKPIQLVVRCSLLLTLALTLTLLLLPLVSCETLEGFVQFLIGPLDSVRD